MRRDTELPVDHDLISFLYKKNAPIPISTSESLISLCLWFLEYKRKSTSYPNQSKIKEIIEELKKNENLINDDQISEEEKNQALKHSNNYNNQVLVWLRDTAPKNI